MPGVREAAPHVSWTVAQWTAYKAMLVAGLERIGPHGPSEGLVRFCDWNIARLGQIDA